VHRGHLQVPCGMSVRGGRRQSICHKEAFYVRQTDSDILGSGHHPVGVRTR